MKAITTNNQNVSLQLSIEEISNQTFQQIGDYVLYPELIDGTFHLYTTFGKQPEKERKFSTIEEFNKQYETCIRWGLKKAGLRLKKSSKTNENKYTHKNNELSSFLKNYRLSVTTFGSTVNILNQTVIVTDYKARRKKPFVCLTKDNKELQVSMQTIQELLPA